MNKWAIVYGDKSIFTSEDGSPADAPGLNVQVIVMIGKENYLIRGEDYYVWRADLDCWEERATLFGLWDYLFHSPGYKVVISGRTMDNDGFVEILQIAKGLLPSG